MFELGRRLYFRLPIRAKLTDNADSLMGKLEKQSDARQLADDLAALDAEIVALVSRRIERCVELAEDELRQAFAISAKKRSGRSFKRPKNISASEATRLIREIDSICGSKKRGQRISFLGPKFSYSYLAAAQQFGVVCNLEPRSSIAGVFEAVRDGSVAYGVVPLENSTDGRIADTLTMFSAHPLTIQAEIHLPVHHCLVGSGKLSEVRKVHSKPQAISQCRNWLDLNLPESVVRIPANSSAEAALSVKEEGVESAAIASREAALEFGLDLLAEDISDQKGNLTRFVVIVHPDNPSISLPTKTGSDKTSLMFEITHQPGALADVMNIFKRSKLNMTWIESFPKPGRFSEYTFFVEFQGHQKEARVRNALQSMGRKTETLRVLGSYPAVNVP